MQLAIRKGARCHLSRWLGLSLPLGFGQVWISRPAKQQVPKKRLFESDKAWGEGWYPAAGQECWWRG